MQLYETYRPDTLEKVLGQDKIVTMLRRLVDAKRVAGRAYWFAGKSGTGKTTLARILAGHVASPDMVQELDAGTLTPAGLKTIEDGLHTFGMGAKTGRAVLINEAHGLRKDSIRALLVILERIPDHVVWAFTTTIDGATAIFEDCDDAAPLLSRCVAMQLTTQGLAKAFAERAKEIAEELGLGGGKPMSAYMNLANSTKSNFRTMLQQIDIGAML